MLSPVDLVTAVATDERLPTPQPVIRQETKCGTTFFISGMDAFVQKPMKIYSIPRYQLKEGNIDDQVIGWLEMGDKLNLLPSQDSPICYHNSLFWYVRNSATGQEGWVIEWYTPHRKDRVSLDPGRYLHVEPP